MKKIFLLLTCFVFSVFIGHAQIVDTTFYDQNWRGVKFKELARYIRYDFNFNDPSYENKSRIFYINGQLESEGTPLKIDKFNGSNSLWKNELIKYYINGNKMQVLNYNNIGLLHGKSTSWSENGNIILEQEFQNGKLHGQVLEFPVDQPDLCYSTIYENGIPKNNETTIYYKTGRIVKVDFLTKKIKKTNPQTVDCKSTYKDGIASWYYDMNGIYASLNFTKTNQFGKYYQCILIFENNSNDPIEINPEYISGKYHKAGKSKDIELMPAEEYLAKIARTQAFAQAMAGFASGMSTYNAGYSSSTTTANVVGRSGWATGTSTTTSYNPYERQAILNMEQQKLQNQAQNDKLQKDAIDGSILKRTVVQPGEKIVKSFYIKYLSSDELEIDIKIEGISYLFKMGKT